MNNMKLILESWRKSLLLKEAVYQPPHIVSTPPRTKIFDMIEKGMKLCDPQFKGENNKQLQSGYQKIMMDMFVSYYVNKDNGAAKKQYDALMASTEKEPSARKIVVDMIQKDGRSIESAFSNKCLPTHYDWVSTILKI